MSIDSHMSIAKSVLIVEDDAVSLILLTKLVERVGYKALAAADGLQALEVLKKQAVDLVIADYDMPNMNGIELLKKVRAEHPSVPFVLVTSDQDLNVIREAWESGAFDFFRKPVFVDRLTQTLQLALEYGHLSISRRKFAKVEQVQPDPELLNIAVARELALALTREDLLAIVDEYEVNARIEFEQIVRRSHAREIKQVRALAHRLAGTSINLGMVRMYEEMKAIEQSPAAPMLRTSEIEDIMRRSIDGVRNYLSKTYMSWLEKKNSA